MWRVQKSFRSPCAPMTDVPRVGLAIESWAESETRKVDSPLKLSRGNQDTTEKTEKTETPQQIQSETQSTSKLQTCPQHPSRGGTPSKATIESLIAQLALPLNGEPRSPLSRDQSGESYPKEVRAASCPCALDGEPISLLTQQLQALKKQSAKLPKSQSPSKRRIQKENKKPNVNVSPFQDDSPPSCDHERHYLTPKEQSRALRKSESQTDPRGNRKKKYFLPRSRALPTPPRTRTCTTRRCQCPQAKDSTAEETGVKDMSPCFKGKKLTSARLLEFRRFSISPEELQPGKKNISSSDDEVFAQKEEKELKPRKKLVIPPKRQHRRKLVFEEDEESIPAEMVDSSLSSLTPLSRKKPDQGSAFFESPSGTPPVQTGGLGRKKSGSPSSRASPLSPQKPGILDSPSPTLVVPPTTTKKLDSGLRRTTTTRQLLSSENLGDDSDPVYTSEEESEEGDSSDQDIGSNSRRKKKLSFDTGTKDDDDNFCQFIVEL